MKKVILSVLAIMICSVPAMAAPGHHPGGPAPGVRAANYHGGVHRAHVSHIAPNHRPGHHFAGRPLPPPPPPRIYRPYRPYRPYIMPYYNTYYTPTYYSASYTYYPAAPVASVEPVVQTVVVRDNYAGINTAANVINAAANVASTIRFLTW